MIGYKDKKEIITKLPDIGTSIFTTMSQMASDSGALNLAQGFPDFDTDEELVELVHHYMKSGMNQYAPSNGIPKLREGIAKLFSSNYNLKISPDKEVTITSGAIQ